MAAWPIRFSTGTRQGKRPHAPDLNGEDTKRKNDRQFYEKEKRPEWKFQNKWQENREWLQYNVNENNMTCSLCIQYSNASTNKSSNLKNKNLFVPGCKNFRFSTVVDHENSKGH
jgi:hypothetical protein